MSRSVITDLFPMRPASIAGDVVVVAPHSGIGTELGAPSRSLQSIAKEMLKRNGFGIASPIRAARALDQAVRDVRGQADDSSAIARHIRETVGAILRSGVDTTTVIQHGSPKAIEAAMVAARYADLLAAERLIDSDAVLVEALRQNLVFPQKILVYGYFRARQLPARSEEIEFIDRLAADGSVFYLPVSNLPLFAANREWAELLRSRGWWTEPQSTDTPKTPIERIALHFATSPADGSGSEKFDAVSYPDLATEVRATLARAKAAVLAGAKPGSIAIVCRDIGLYSKAIAATAREYQLPVDIDCEIPIGESAFGEFLALVFDVLELRHETDIAAGKRNGNEGFQYEPTLRLLLHRLGPGLSEQQRCEAYKWLPNTIDAWKPIFPEVEVLEVSGKREPADWVAWLSRLFSRWGLRQKEKLGVSAAEIATFDKFFDSLEQLACERGFGPTSLIDLAADVADVLANIKTLMHTERGGVRVLMPNNAVGCQFERVFVMGMAEGVLPAPAVDSNVIDFFERDRLHDWGAYFENALEVPRWEALTFYFTLLSAKNEVAFSYPQFAGDSEQIESAYFKRMGLSPVRPADRFVSSIEEYRRAYLLTQKGDSSDRVLDSARHQQRVEFYRESDAPPDKYDGIIGIPVSRSSWSASSLARIGSCPFRWFASDLLRLKQPDESETELAPNVRGSLLHKTLEVAARRSTGSNDIRSAMLSMLEEAFNEAEALNEYLALVSNWRLCRSENIEKLERAIAADEFIAEGAIILETEKEFVAEFCGFRIKGTIDRIDRMSDGRLVAVDYKHGSYVGRIKDGSGYLRIEVQLPIYSTIALPALFPEHSIAGGNFYHLSEPKVTRGKDADLEKIFNGIKALLEEGRFAVDPDVRQEACTYCEYDVVCRVGPRVALKNNAKE